MSIRSNVFPAVFKILEGEKQATIKNFERLRRDKPHRMLNKTTIIHSLQSIQRVISAGFQIKSLGITAPLQAESLDAIKFDSRQVIDKLDQFPAERYYVTELARTRQILGQHAKVGNWEVYAEVPFPNTQFPEKINRLLVLDRIENPAIVGNMIRTAKALGWDSVCLTPGTVDPFDSEVMRHSRLASLFIPIAYTLSPNWNEYVKQHDLNIMLSQMVPKDIVKDDVSDKKTPLQFWDNLTKKLDTERGMKLLASGRVALVVGKKHSRRRYTTFPMDSLCVGIPMLNHVKSLNTSVSGSILMNEISRLMGYGVQDDQTVSQ
ncbi:2263_t:CDS:1 [Paraglomus brasilianum]|uniref:2263_t:CDS:1 n=1 Tax=Paraglomus brasilianum TaxID=144538 RepID=A0A9N9BHG4_9GLOM|nr:2263_t:CDS:1 [Paraglomus brasilianum]